MVTDAIVEEHLQEFPIFQLPNHKICQVLKDLPS
jgi:hypothetical protein